MSPNNEPAAHAREQEKVLAAKAAVGYVRSGMLLGLGTGSTADHFIRFLGERVRAEGLAVTGIPTSRRTQAGAREAGIPLIAPARGVHPDLAIDGADEVGPGLSLIKGGGGALLRERVVAAAARYFLVLADSSKLVGTLGRFPLPVECVPFAMPWVMDALAGLGGKPAQRHNPDAPLQPWVTDQGNWLIDCAFTAIPEPHELAESISRTPGVVAHGLFLDMVDGAILADGSRATLCHRDMTPRPLPASLA